MELKTQSNLISQKTKHKFTVECCILSILLLLTLLFFPDKCSTEHPWGLTCVLGLPKPEQVALLQVGLGFYLQRHRCSTSSHRCLRGKAPCLGELDRQVAGWCCWCWGKQTPLAARSSETHPASSGLQKETAQRVASNYTQWCRGYRALSWRPSSLWGASHLSLHNGTSSGPTGCTHYTWPSKQTSPGSHRWTPSRSWGGLPQSWPPSRQKWGRIPALKGLTCTWCV